MKLWLVLLLASPAPAAVVRSAPAALSGAAAGGAAAVNFDGGAPASMPLLRVEGTPFMRYGPTLIDTRAPGAAELMKSAVSPVKAPVIGIFEVKTSRVVNSFMLGSFGVHGHSDALPRGRPVDEVLGGYTLSLGDDGQARFWGSGSVPAPVTPAVQRAVLRHVGARPAAETASARLRRAWLRFYDEARVLLGW